MMSPASQGGKDETIKWLKLFILLSKTELPAS